MELKTVIKVSQESRAEAKQALASAGPLDGKAASAFEETATNIDLLTRAIVELEKGVAGSTLLQSRIGSAIRKIAVSAEKVSDSDITTLLSFLSNGDRQQHAPQSGDIIGILKQLKEECRQIFLTLRRLKRSARPTAWGSLKRRRGSPL